MGRDRTGAVATNEVPRIEMTFLLNRGFIEKGKTVRGSLSWSSRGESAGSISFLSVYTNSEQYLRLFYTVTDRENNQWDYDYRILFETVPSNLGKGDVLYFVCPTSFRRCRVLYRAYGSHVWKARQAYEHRIYYPLQVSSHMSRYNDKYWELEKKREALSKRRFQQTYKGRKTKHAARMELLFDKLEMYDQLRWGPWAMPKRLRYIFPEPFNSMNRLP
jgi:hypothetical protein